MSVSYTHLDVYKRQVTCKAIHFTSIVIVRFWRQANADYPRAASVNISRMINRYRICIRLRTDVVAWLRLQVTCKASVQFDSTSKL